MLWSFSATEARQQDLLRYALDGHGYIFPSPDLRGFKKCGRGATPISARRTRHTETRLRVSILTRRLWEEPNERMLKCWIGIKA